MGLYVTLEILKQEDICLDIDALNQELQNSNFVELFEDVDGFDHVKNEYFIMENDKLEMATQMEGYWEGYGDLTQYYFTFIDEANMIAKHLSSGKLVFKMNIESNSDEYFIITPNNVIHKTDKDLF